MFERGTCVRVSNVPFASERAQKGKWVSRHNPETGKYELVRFGGQTRGHHHSVHGDTIDPLQSMVNGQMFDSKSALRRHYKEEGYVEVGNDLVGYRGTPECQMESYQDSMREVLQQWDTPSWREQEMQRRDRERIR